MSSRRSSRAKFLPDRCCVAWASYFLNDLSSRTALSTSKASSPPQTKGVCWCSFLREHSLAGPGFPASTWALFGSRRRQSCRWSRLSCVERGRCCVAINGFHDGARSASASPSPFNLPAATLPLSYGYDSVRAVVLAGCEEPDLGELIKPAQPAAKR